MTDPRGTAWVVAREAGDRLRQQFRYLRVEGVFEYPKWVTHPSECTPMTAAKAMQWADALRFPPHEVEFWGGGTRSYRTEPYPEHAQPKIYPVDKIPGIQEQAPTTEREGYRPGSY